MNNFALYNTPIGSIYIGYESNFITKIKKINGLPDGVGTPNNLTEMVFQQLLEYFDGKRQKFDFPYILKGTDFQKKVWDELLKIPYGETRTYKQIAITIGNEKASRAVGMANNKNPVSIVVPCHRVIGSDKSLVGYSEGLEMKKFLLDLEKTTKNL